MLPLETELKYLVKPEVYYRLAKKGFLVQYPYSLSPTDLFSGFFTDIYFDTQDMVLFNRGYFLRVTNGNTVTLKAVGNKALEYFSNPPEALSVREESLCTPRTEVLSLLATAGLTETKVEDLQQVTTIRQLRKKFDLNYLHHRIAEVSVDTVHTPLSRWHELEVEFDPAFEAGDIDWVRPHMLAMNHAIMAMTDVRPASASKFQRALYATHERKHSL